MASTGLGLWLLGWGWAGAGSEVPRAAFASGMTVQGKAKGSSDTSLSSTLPVVGHFKLTSGGWFETTSGALIQDLPGMSGEETERHPPGR